MISSKLRRPERRVLHLVGAQVLINGIGIRDDLRDQPLRFASSRPAGRTKAGADHQEVIAGLGVTSAIQSLDGNLKSVRPVAHRLHGAAHLDSNRSGGLLAAARSRS